MPNQYLNLNSLKPYVIADELSDLVWDIVFSWDWFSKRTLGIQHVTAIDSIGGNAAEGFGRHHKKEKQKFYYNSRGSVYESIFWTEKAKKRKLINDLQYKKISSELEKLPKELNWLIKLTEEKLKE